MKATIFIFLVAVAMSSCSDLHQKQQLEQIDQMVVSIDSMKTVLENNQLAEARVMSDSIKAIEDRCKKYYIPDTINRQIHQEINDLKQSRKILSHVEQDYNNFTKGCDEMKESLRQLRYDIDNSDGDRKKYKEYISFEKSKLTDLSRLSKDYVEEKDLSVERYNLLYNKWSKFSWEQKKLNAKKLGI